MAHHYLGNKNIEWIKKMKNIFLIRHPKDVIISYTKHFTINDIKQIGYPQLTKLFNLVTNTTQQTPLIIDSSDIINNPKKTLTKLCDKLNIPFYDNMVHWPQGIRCSDGIWGTHWYTNVIKSNGFYKKRYSNTKIPTKYADLYKEAMKHYKTLYNLRME